MYIAEIQYEFLTVDHDESMRLFKIECLESQWFYQNRICDADCRLIKSSSSYISIVSLPERFSLSISSQSGSVKEMIRDLKQEEGLLRYTVRVLGQAAGCSSVCRCRHRSACILVWNRQSEESAVSPMVCGDCHRPVPLYRLNGADELINWASVYDHTEALWFKSAAGERSSYRQLSEFKSTLNQDGLAEREKVQRLTGVPVYYNLFRYHARNLKWELARRCPSCRGKWLLDSPWHGLYDFRCDQCRLVSNIATTVRRR